jgi:ABC-type transporter Mla MlaB component
MTSLRALRPPLEPGTIVLVMGASIGPGDIPRLCRRARLFLEDSDAEVVVCDVGALVDPDAVAVDALARLQLTAVRLGRRIRLRHPCAELQELVALMGLSDVLPPCEG